MGYHTTFKLDVLNLKGENVNDEFKAKIERAKKYKTLTDEDRANYRPEYIAELADAACSYDAAGELFWEAFNYGGILDRSGDSMKWYDHEMDMKRASEAYPEYIFELYGEGEKAGDLWKNWFHRGQMQGGAAEVILPEFDPNGWE